jgi:putative sterol carrier protein
MPARFPSADWLNALQGKLNSDARYNEVARNWEGDLIFDIQPGGNLAKAVTMYLDLWHGGCRNVDYAEAAPMERTARFILRSHYENFTAILLGRMDAMTAMMKSRLKVEGSLGYMMRDVPTVLDFVRCAREITTEIL